MDAWIAHTKRLQDLLGVMNDVAVMRGLLDEILSGIDDEALQYAGGIVGWRTCYYYRVLEDFEECRDECVEAKHPMVEQGRCAPWLTGLAPGRQLSAADCFALRRKHGHGDPVAWISRAVEGS